MFHIIKPGTKIDFLSKAPLFLKISLAALAASVILMFVPGVKLGLDFTGGYEILVALDQKVEPDAIRAEVSKLGLGDTSVQSYEVPDSAKSFFLVRVQRSEVLAQKDLDQLNGAFSQRYGDQFKGPVIYDPEVGNVVDVVFTSTQADTSSAAISQVIGQTDHKVRRVRKVGRPSEARFSVTLMGVDVTIVEALRAAIDPATEAVRVEFVGPTVGKQLRDDGILAMLYAMICILIYIALRFDFFFSPGAIACVFHDAVLTVGLMVVFRQEFNLATIAGLLTLIGYSINDTIIIYDRVRETVGKAQGTALKEVLNRAVNETLPRTIMTSSTTFLACVCLIIFGKGTVLAQLGLIMAFGVVVGTYSSVYVAAPLFMFLRERFGPKEQVKGARTTSAGAVGAQPRP